MLLSRSLHLRHGHMTSHFLGAGETVMRTTIYIFLFFNQPSKETGQGVGSFFRRVKEYRDVKNLREAGLSFSLSFLFVNRDKIPTIQGGYKNSMSTLSVFSHS